MSDTRRTAAPDNPASLGGPAPVLERVHRVVALAVEPFELLAEAGGLLLRLAAHGAAIEVLLVTDGVCSSTTVARRFSRLGLREVPRIRLGLSRPVPRGAGNDVLAALSEIVGFDPDPGLAMLAPAPLTVRTERAVLSRAARLAAGIYHTDLIRYLPADAPVRQWAARCPLTAEEARRKRYALGLPAVPADERFFVDHTIPAQRAGS